MTIRKLSMVVMGLIVAAAFSMPVMGDEHDQQPHMREALETMKQAEHQLEQAEHDKGGHREKALQHLRAAIREAEQGTKYDDKHDDHHDDHHDNH
jgi:hypothetical protein